MGLGPCYGRGFKGFGPEGASGPRRQPTGPFRGHLGTVERVTILPIPATIISLNADADWPMTSTGAMLLNQVAQIYSLTPK